MDIIFTTKVTMSVEDLIKSISTDLGTKIEGTTSLKELRLLVEKALKTMAEEEGVEISDVQLIEN